ncbi:MAG TPA: di-heme oxidoredictase family protein [Bradyrhizobium sp.]|uniref:di-heme oxidoredictase family protein n=1 Tax=Bradyrhizobium sp. TaxID=376 RepID=UPI002D7F6760|nr:di-heme oxidoredictase family protein [Bradyrhizobium sp.]HET7885988.1 di-heme oxidoredictase family protein [Bradyrhizobium sp.]
MQNTGGGLQAQGKKIPPPPLIGPSPSEAAITDNEKALFYEGILRAGQLESTCDNCAMVTDGSPAIRNPNNGLREADPIFPQFTTNSNGLGARHNADQCFACHAQPTFGGSGGFLVPNPVQVAQGLPARPPENPQFNLIPHRFGKQNVVPSFELQYGPIREVRFIHKVDANGDFIHDTNGNPIPDGGVHQLWTVRGIQGDQTISSCSLVQPDFEKQVRQHNVAFRIPLQMLGLGLIESIQDREILSHQAATASARAALGIAGRPNRSGNDGTITRFGWKAQNKSITMFAGEAYNVEMGITNELFPTATEEDPNCNGANKPEPNDVTRTENNDRINQSFHNPLHILADWMEFQVMMRFTDGPRPEPYPSRSAIRGKQVFSDIGCALCHTPTMQTAPVMNSAVLQDRPVNLYSDILLHDMGTGLADGVSQGQAGPREFRTTPLWGVGQRIFFLHDGRTNDLLVAIAAHASNGSEANAVIDAFNSRSKADKQAVLDFLRSL